MTITPKQAKLGYVLVALSFLIFGFYWYYLLEPLQNKLIEAHKSPSLILTILRSLIFGSIFTTIFFIGGCIGGFAWQKFADTVKVRLGEALESKSFITFLILSNAVILAFSLWWKYDNF